jgi:glyoxylase-like metal-dependent hydrolase (beta-lactamase superfamily II)
MVQLSIRLLVCVLLFSPALSLSTAEDEWTEVRAKYTFTLDQRCPESAKSHIGKPPVQQFKTDCPDGIYDLAPIPDHNGAWDPMNTTLFRHYLGNDAFAIIDRRALPEIFEAEGKAAATSGGFIYTDDGIILIESFLNEFMACQARALILECYPDVPIKFVLLTSHHGDHAFGTYYWQAPEVTYVMHQNTKQFLANPTSLNAERLFIEGSMGPDSVTDIFKAVPQTQPSVTTLNQDMTISLGGTTVVAKYFGFGQTDGDLFFYHADSNTLYGGNTINGPMPALAWLLDGHLLEGLEAMQNVEDFVQEKGITQIVPGHGAPVDPGPLLSYLNGYLRDLAGGVQHAVNQRMTFSQTLAAVSLDNYTQYSAWYMRHILVNVPFAYVELGALADPPLKLELGEKCSAVCVEGGMLLRDPAGSACDFCESGFCSGGNWWKPFWEPAPAEPNGVCA